MSTLGPFDIPSCSAHASAADYTVSGADGYDIRKWSYYKGVLLSANVLPAVIVGGLCLLVAAIVFIWLLTLCCRSVGWSTRQSRIRDSPSATNKRRRACGFALDFCILVILLGVIGTGTWALVTGLKDTSGDVNQVWDLVANVQTKLDDIYGTISGLVASLSSLQASISSSMTALSSLTAPLSVLGLDVGAISAQLQSVAGSVSSGLSQGQQTQADIQTDGINRLQTYTNDYKAPTVHASDTWRIVAIALFFGLLIAFSLICGVLALLDRTPRTLAAFTLGLWVIVGIVILLGAGAVNFVYRVGQDSCLYAEPLAIRLVIEDSSNADIPRALNYYFGKLTIAADDVASELYNLNITSIQEELGEQQVALLSAALNTSAGVALVEGDSSISGANAQQILAFPAAISNTSSGLDALNAEIQASEFYGLYNEAKVLICCSLTNSVYDIWVSATVAGAIAGALAILVTVKVVRAVVPLSERYDNYDKRRPTGTVSEPPRQELPMAHIQQGRPPKPLYV